MKAVWIGLAALAGLAGMWGYATYDLGARAHAYQQAVDEMHFIERGGSVMTEDAIFDRLEAFGPPAGVEVVEMNVLIEPLSEGNMEDAPAPTRLVANAVEDDESLSMQGTLIDIDVEIRARKWLWDTEERVQVRRTVGQQLVMQR